MSKNKASGFNCNVSLKCIQAPDGFYVFKSEGGEGEFDDDDDEEDDDKVVIPSLNEHLEEDDDEDNNNNNNNNPFILCSGYI